MQPSPYEELIIPTKEALAIPAATKVDMTKTCLP
jgi:hypothetical protein